MSDTTVSATAVSATAKGSDTSSSESATTMTPLPTVRDISTEIDAQMSSVAAHFRTAPKAPSRATSEIFLSLSREDAEFVRRFLARLRPDTNPVAHGETHEPPRLAEEFAIVFRAAKYERFHDGVHSAFSRKFTRLLEVYGTAAVVALEQAIGSNEHPPEVVAEALRWLPFVAESEAYKYRLNVLEKGLRDQSAIVRDAATAALGSLDDPRALPALEAALASERLPEVRAVMQDTAQQLLRRDWARS